MARPLWEKRVVTCGKLEKARRRTGSHKFLKRFFEKSRWETAVNAGDTSRKLNEKFGHSKRKKHRTPGGRSLVGGKLAG